MLIRKIFAGGAVAALLVGAVVAAEIGPSDQAQETITKSPDHACAIGTLRGCTDRARPDNTRLGTL